MRELLHNDYFMTWALALGVYLMFFALGWKTTDPDRMRYKRPAPHWSRQLHLLLNPLSWFAIAVAGPSILSVVLVRHAQAEFRRRRAVAAMRRAGLHFR